MSAGSLPLVLDFLGVFAFALNGALTAIGTARLDIVGIITLAMITALGGGIVRDILLGVAPPITFRGWRYLVVATVGGVSEVIDAGCRLLASTAFVAPRGESCPAVAVHDARVSSLLDLGTWPSRHPRRYHRCPGI